MPQDQINDMDNALVETLACRLRDAQSNRAPVAPIRDELATLGVAGAYAVQLANTRHGLSHGRRLVGRKIGLTARSVQAQLGVDQPDYGMLFADMALCDGDYVAPDAVLQPKVEAEVAFMMGREVIQADATPAEVIAAVEFVLPAIEVVGSRIEAWNIKLLDTVADNASSGLYVVGHEPRRLQGIDLRLCGMVMERDGEEVSTGNGAACLGHPLNAVVWLARKMAEVGQPLRAGDLVMSGALGPMVSARPGDHFEARIDGLGSVRVGFAA
jgi:2-keto-4-pentenoate hydratase